MAGVDPQTVIEEAEQEAENQSEYAKEVMEWFTTEDNTGALYPISEATEAVAEGTGLEEEQVREGIRGTVGDIVDPVQQVEADGVTYIGTIEYHEWTEQGVYGYVHYDDVEGRKKRAVCSRCVKKHDRDNEIATATEGRGSIPEGATWEDVADRVEEHIRQDHSVDPSEVTVGATLNSGTTIAGNDAFHKGNDGAGSGLNADTLQGDGPSTYIEVQIQSTEPSSTSVIWLDTSFTPPRFKAFDSESSSWGANVDYNDVVNTPSVLGSFALNSGTVEVSGDLDLSGELSEGQTL